MLLEELLRFLFDAFCEPGDFLVLDYYFIVEVGPELIFPLVILVPEFLHFVLEEEYLELIIVDECGLHLL